MYLGWNVRQRISREYWGDVESRAFAFGNKDAICSAINFGIVAVEGEKLNDALDGVGVEPEQFSAQHKRAILASGVLSLLFALLQHFIMRPLGE